MTALEGAHRASGSIQTPSGSPLGTPANRRADFAIALAIIALAVVLRAPLLRWDIVVGDEGYLVAAVERVLDGQVPYRDFQRDYAPGMYYLFAGLFTMVGDDLLVTRIVWLVMLCIVSAGCYLVARKLAPRWAAVWAGLLPILLMPPIHKMIVPLSVVAGLALCLPLARAVVGRKSAFATGAAIGLMAFFRQDVAAYTFVIASLTLVVASVLGAPARRGSAGRAISPWVWMCAGVLMFWAPILSAFASIGALREMIAQMLFDGLKDNAGMSVPLPAMAGVFSGTLSQRLLTSIFYLPTTTALIGTCAIIAAAVRRKFSVGYIILAQWTLMALFVHLVYMVRCDVAHIKQGLTAPSLILAWAAGAVWAHGRQAPRGRVRQGAAFATAMLCAWACAVLCYGAISDLKAGYDGMRAGVALDEPKAMVFLPEVRCGEMTRLVAAVRANTAKGDPIFVAPCEPILFFLTQRRNPTRYDSLFPGIVSSPAVQAEIVRDMEKSQVRLVLLCDYVLDGVPERRFRVYMPQVAAHIAKNFRAAGRIRGWEVWLRKLPGRPIRRKLMNAPGATSARMPTGSPQRTGETPPQSR